MKTLVYNTKTRTFSESTKTFASLDAQLMRLAKLNEDEGNVRNHYQKLRTENEGQLSDKDQLEQQFKLDVIRIERSYVDRLIARIRQYDQDLENLKY